MLVLLMRFDLRDYKTASCSGCASHRGLHGFAFDDDPESVRHALKLRELEAVHEFGQPPRGGFLYEMRIAAVRQDLRCGTRVNCEYTDTGRYALEIVEDVVEKVRLDVLQHVDTRDELARLRRVRPLRNSGIVMMDREILVEHRLE